MLIKEGIKLTISEETKVVVVKVTTTKAAPDTTQKFKRCGMSLWLID